MLIRIVLFISLICSLVYSLSKPTSTPFICIEPSNKTTTTNLPSCLPGYVLDIDNVLYESTHDDSCSGITRCRIEHKNSLAFACNRKRTCQIDLVNLHFHINSTCGTTRRFFIYYRCLPIIQEQKDYLCESPTQRRPSLGDINLSCLRNYRLFILNAWIGLSLRSVDDYSARIKCNKDTLTTCLFDLSTNYRHLCDYQSKQECKISYNQRPTLDQCHSGTQSNFSLVEYLCIPDEGTAENLPRVDICSSDQRLTLDRGLLYSSSDSERVSCEKELLLPRDSRLRLFLLEKSPDFQIEYLNQIQTLELNQYFDAHFNNRKKDNGIKFHWKPNEIKSNFLLYFQIDSKISEYAPYIFEFNSKSNSNRQHGILSWKQILGIILACAILLLLLVVIIYLFIRRRPRRDSHYIKDNDDHRQQLNIPPDQPYLTTGSPTTLLGPGQQRPYSTTSSIIMQQIHDETSDRESLIKSTNPAGRTVVAGDIDNFYEEIKEQQQQTAFALRMNSNPNLYLEPNDFRDTKPFLQGQQTAQPIRDHHEVFYYECEK